MSKSHLLKIACIILPTIVAAPLSAQDMYVQTYHINPVTSPKNPVDTLADCFRDDVCGGILEIAATYVGIPPGTISSVAVASKAVSNRQEGEQEWFEWPSPNNYAVCRVQFHTNSIAPEGRTRFAISASVGRVGVFTQTPLQNLGGGRSWYDGFVNITYVRSALHNENFASGACNIQSQQFGYSCTSRAEGCNGTVDLGESKKTVDNI